MMSYVDTNMTNFIRNDSSLILCRTIVTLLSRENRRNGSTLVGSGLVYFSTSRIPSATSNPSITLKTKKFPINSVMSNLILVPFCSLNVQMQPEPAGVL